MRLHRNESISIAVFQMIHKSNTDISECDEQRGNLQRSEEAARIENHANPERLADQTENEWIFPFPVEWHTNNIRNKHDDNLDGELIKINTNK